MPLLFAWQVSVLARVMSNVRSFCQSKESAPVGKWFARFERVGRRNPPSAARDPCVGNGYASSLGAWYPGASAPSRCNICSALNATKFREAVTDEYKNRCDAVSICKDIFAACPRMAEFCRETPAEFRSALSRL